nr:hypothetical protein [Pandoravirus massiliensis]
MHARNLWRSALRVCIACLALCVVAVVSFAVLYFSRISLSCVASLTGQASLVDHERSPTDLVVSLPFVYLRVCLFVCGVCRLAPAGKKKQETHNRAAYHAV